jgi:hypothetical protein
MTSEDNKAGSDQTNVNTGGGDYAEGDIDKRQGGAFVENSTIYGDVIGQQHIYYQPPSTPLDRQQQRNRRAMLAKVKAIWINGLLEQSLAKELRIALDLVEQPDAVELPLNALVQELNRPRHPLPAGTPIIDVFNQMGSALPRSRKRRPTTSVPFGIISMTITHDDAPNSLSLLVYDYQINIFGAYIRRDGWCGSFRARHARYGALDVPASRPS